MVEASARDRSGTGSVVWRTVWRARWLILAAALVAAIGGYLLSAQQSDTYTTESRIVLGQTQPFSPLGDQSFAETSRYVANQASIMTSQAVLQSAVVALDDGTGYTELLESVDVTASADSDVITVVAAAPSPEGAAARVQEVVDAYRTFAREQVAREAGEAQAATTDPQVLDQIRTRAASFGDGVAFAEDAPVPGAPSGPQPLRDALVLAMVAALLAAAVALWRRSASAEGPAHEEMPAPVLGAVPVRASDRAGTTAPLAAEFAMTAVAVDYAVAGRPGPVLVTALAADGPTGAVVEGLAAAEAVRHRRVLVVDADPHGAPLVAAARSARPLSALAAEWRATPPPRGAHLQVATLDVAAEGVRPVLEELAGRFDLVLVRVGSVVADAAAFAMVGQADAVLAVVTHHDRSSDLDVLVDRLRTAGRELTGIVLTEVSQGGGSAARRPMDAAPATPASPPTRIDGPRRVSHLPGVPAASNEV